jgi:hypothetical protein
VNTTFDKFTRNVVVSDQKLVRSPFELARVKLFEDGVAATLGAGEALSLLITPRNQFDATLSASASLTSAELHASGEYRKFFTTNTAGVLQVLRKDANPSNDLPEGLFHGTWVHHNVGDTVQLVSHPFELIITNSNYNGAITAAESVSGITNAGYWTSIDDGSETALNSIVTDDGAFPLENVVYTAINDEFNVWKLKTNVGAIASDGVNFQRPLDYHATNNNVIWVRIA